MDTNRRHYPILLAEDDLISRRLFEKLLAKEGFDVTTVANGREALDLFRKRFFPIVLTDWQMPEMEGTELCRAIRDENPDRYVFIVMLTSKGSKDDIIKGLGAGADDYLTKPAHHAELVARIKTGIRILELERSLKAAVDEIHLMSITDPLTGVYNRGYINERLPQEIRRSIRYGRNLSVIMCDIDHFKTVNDTYGHLAGDSVLKGFAHCLTITIRQQVDWAGRYGGEEFLLVLPETDQAGAMALAERLRETVEACESRIDDCVITITASFGVTGFLPQQVQRAVRAEALLQQADTLLYEAKAAGRNRVMWPTPNWPEGVPQEIADYDIPLFNLIDEAAQNYPTRPIRFSTTPPAPLPRSRTRPTGLPISCMPKAFARETGWPSFCPTCPTTRPFISASSKPVRFVSPATRSTPPPNSTTSSRMPVPRPCSAWITPSFIPPPKKPSRAPRWKRWSSATSNPICLAERISGRLAGQDSPRPTAMRPAT
jgi:two-component system cell cycle response regulator